MTVKPLAADKLCQRTDPAQLPFETTANLPEADGPVGQDRAMRALVFGARMTQPGYNIFVTGPQGSGKHSSIKRALERMAATMPAPSDWCYVHNFAQSHRPKALRFPPGEGARFQKAMTEFVESLKGAMVTLFDSEDYRRRRETIEENFREHVDGTLATLRSGAEKQGLALVENSEGGFEFRPQRDGLVLVDEDYRRLSKGERDRLAARAHDLGGELDQTMKTLEARRQEAVASVRALDRELGEAEVRRMMVPLSDGFRAIAPAQAHIEAVFQDVMTHLDALQAGARGESDAEGRSREGEVPFHRYAVNLLVDNSGAKGAPVVSLALPSLSQLVGKVEHVPLLVTVITDFMYIRGGALHRANGGFLLIDVLDLLQQDVSWEALKRALHEMAVRIENLAEVLDRSQTLTIQPEPIPLDLKAVLFGEPWLFWRLRELDADFADLFKVQADFSLHADRNDENGMSLMRLLASVARQGGLRQLSRSGAARMIDEAARLAGDAHKLSVRTSQLADLLREADHFARESGRSLITGEDVAMAVAAKEDRGGRLKALEHELIERRILFIDTDGKKVGQVNGITVLSAAGFAFGMPARITARVRPGDGKVTDIDRMADFSGPTHAKGVQILTGYLNGHYSRNGKLSLSASIAFEQSYGPVDGDSASAAELIAVLSAAADVPLKQGIAITGSINQHGEMQPIGGANEKIEGFFDICALRGFAKGNGVIIPRTNVMNLMLRDDVVDAVRQGKFQIYAVDTVDEAIEILTGLKAGTRAANGRFPRGSFNARVMRRLTWFARPRLLRPVHLDGWWPF